MQAMKERDDRKLLSGAIQLIHAYWGGGKRRGGKRGRFPANKAPFVAAVALNKEGHPLAKNMTVVKGFWLTESIRSGQRSIYNPAARLFRTDYPVFQWGNSGRLHSCQRGHGRWVTKCRQRGVYLA